MDFLDGGRDRFGEAVGDVEPGNPAQLFHGGGHRFSVSFTNCWRLPFSSSAWRSMPDLIGASSSRSMVSALFSMNIRRSSIMAISYPTHRLVATAAGTSSFSLGSC